MATKTKINRDKTSWTAKEIYEAEMTPIKWLIEEILPQGFGFIAGRKKIGKSFMVLQAALAVANPKGEFLGYKVKHGRVLYLSLEGSARQIKRRMDKMIQSAGVKDISFLNNLEIEENWKKLNNGGFEDLLKRIASKKYVWIIFDTWQKCFRIKNQNDTNDISKVIDPLYEITRAGDLTITFVDHFHKPNQYSGDIVDDISGSGVKGGVADTVWGLTRQRGQQDARLDIVSRDTEIDGLDITFSKDMGIWMAKKENDVKPNTIQASILQYMRLSEEDAYIMQLAKVFDKDHALISKEMGELVKKGIIKPGNKNGKRQPYKLVN